MNGNDPRRPDHPRRAPKPQTFRQLHKTGGCTFRLHYDMKAKRKATLRMASHTRHAARTVGLFHMRN